MNKENKTCKKAEFLIVVESPSKIKKIKSFLGNKYDVIATKGHLCQLIGLNEIDSFCKSESPTFQDENNIFTSIDRQIQHINSIKSMIEHYSPVNIILATDNDREGEAIAYHFCRIFGLSVENTKRITFNEITQESISHSINELGKIDVSSVRSQMARSFIDIIIGYSISPLLFSIQNKIWKKSTNKKQNKNADGGTLSAGRCQSVALRIIYDKYMESMNSSTIKQYNVSAYFFAINLQFTFSHNFTESSDVVDFLEKSKTHDHYFDVGEGKMTYLNPPTPLNTAKLLQQANNTLGYSPNKTMAVAQSLYQSGKITYLRTETSKYSKDFIDTTTEFIRNNYGYEAGQCDYVGSVENLSKIENDMLHGQNPHEAIRPTNINDIPNDESEPLYKLIWKNSLQSCMSQSISKTYEITVNSPMKSEKYVNSLAIPIFLGWKKEFQLIKTSDKNKKMQCANHNSDPNKILLYLQTKDSKTPIKPNRIDCSMEMKNIEKHYSESSLIQKLEELGIGRPSTYSLFVETIKERGYVTKSDVDGVKCECKDHTLYFPPDGSVPQISEKTNIKIFGNEKNKLMIQPIGVVCMEYLLQHFNSIFKYEYTNELEEQLDVIANNKAQDPTWLNVVRNFKEGLDKIAFNVPKAKKYTFTIDDSNDFMFHQNTPVIRRKIVNSETVDSQLPSESESESKKNKKKSTMQYEYYPLKKYLNIDIMKLQNNQYKLEDLLEYPNSFLGMYNNTKLHIKYGQYGYFLEWGVDPHLQTKSLNDIDKSVSLHTFDLQMAIDHIEEKMKSNHQSADKKKIFRTIDAFTDIRQGKFGTYIYHKTDSMKKPAFIPLKKCPVNYMTATDDELMKWAYSKI